MSKKTLGLFFLLDLALAMTLPTGIVAGSGDITSYLPGKTENIGWDMEGSPQQAEGEGLFDLINGGAETYLRLGFQRAIISTFSSRGKRINLEVYEMKDPASASAVYARKAGDGGKRIPLGEAAVLHGHYLHFWKGRFQVTLAGYDSEPETLQGLMAIAKAVEERIGRSGDSLSQ